VCLAVSVGLLWLLHGRPESRYHVIALAFPPALWCLVAGQLGIFFLLEVVLFTLFVKTRPWLAGASLVLFAMKPQLFLPFFLVLLLWSIARRRFAVLAGFALAVAVSCTLTWGLDHQVWQQYHEMLRTQTVVDMFVPTAGMALRFGVDRRATWIEFIFEAAACLWAVWYFSRRRTQWDWSTDGALVLLVSMAATPYSWFTDQALLFPALLVGLYKTQHSARALLLFGLVCLGGMIGLIAQIPLTGAYYIWTAPAWLLWYLYAMRVRDSSPATVAAAT
jgi:Glycosyltransferase family 87